MQIQAKEIQLVDIDSLVLNPKNNNKHPKEQIDRLAKLIQYQGFRNPVVVSKRTGFVLAGHGRIEAAKIAGLKEVPAMFQDFENEAQEYAYLTSDNAIASWAELDLSAVNTEMLDLGPDFDIDLLGIKDFVIEPIEKFEPQSDEDAVPDVVHPITRKGDIWLLGNHRLMCGDSTMIDDVEKLMNGERADISFTSPPYNAGKSESLSGNTHSGDNKYNSYNDNQSQSDWLELMIDFTNNSIDHSDLLIMNVQQLSGNKIAFIEYLNHFKNNLVDISIWDKGHGAPQISQGVLANRFEYIVYVTNKQDPKRTIHHSSWQGKFQNVYTAPKQTNNEFSKIHAATFPIHLPEYFISEICDKSKSVIDFFCGTGTTLIACEKTNRKCYGMELDEKYCDVMIKRWEQYTGNKAVLESTNQTYEELKVERDGTSN
jgi:DNA modification methylase